MTMVIVGLVVVAVIVGVVLMRTAGPESAPPPAMPQAPVPTQEDEIDGPTLAGPNARAARLTPDALSAPTAPASELGMVSCTTQGAVHGAMPPFGKLSLEGDVFVFEAASRVQAASSAGLDSGEHASTIQSLGTVELGKYRFEFNRSEVERIDVDGARVTVHTPTHALVFEGYGAGSARVGPWFRDHGLG